MKRASPVGELGAPIIHGFFADWRMTPPLCRGRVVHEYAIETSNPTAMTVVEMIESDTVKLSCRCFGGLTSVDPLSSLEKESGVHQNRRERWTAVPQKKKPLGSASSKLVRAGVLPGAVIDEIIFVNPNSVNSKQRISAKQRDVCSSRMGSGGRRHSNTNATAQTTASSNWHFRANCKSQLKHVLSRVRSRRLFLHPYSSSEPNV